MIDDPEMAHRALAANDELEVFRRVFFSSPDYIAFSRLSDGTYIDVNPGFEQMLGYKRKDVIGKTSFDIGLWPDEDGSQRKAYVERLKRDGRVSHYPARIRTAWGDILDMEASANTLVVNGEAILIVTAKDVTQRKRAEEELLRLNEELQTSNRRKDEFLAMLAHELRNPLAPIGAAADLLRLACLDEASVKQTSEVIARQVKHMASLVDDLLDVSRVTRGLVKLEKVRLDAKRIVADAIEQARPLIEARRHCLTVRMSPEPAFVVGDQKRLVQVVTNLLNNAAKYTPEGGTIDIDMDVDDGHIMLRVADNGIGMAPALLDQAFELFAQAERTPDRSQGGLGIGLALVRSLMQLHEGSVKAESDGIGKGSRFTIFLPHAPAGQGDMSVVEQEVVMQRSPGDALKIMVVDDNADAANMLAMFCEALGHRVFVEHSPENAIERAKREAPNVCLLDIGLPHMDGYELARRLRAQPENASSIFVAVTGYGQEQDRHHALCSGFHHHFVKPVNTSMLAELLTGIGKS